MWQHADLMQYETNPSVTTARRCRSASAWRRQVLHQIGVHDGTASLGLAYFPE